MRDDLKQALQTRWEDSLRDRGAIAPHSPLPLLDELLTAEATHQNWVTPGDRGEDDLPNSSQPPWGAPPVDLDSSASRGGSRLVSGGLAAVDVRDLAGDPGTHPDFWPDVLDGQ
jgi:hypothetical protein